MRTTSSTTRHRIGAALALVLAVFFFTAGAAAAHEGEESGKAVDLVRQAIAIMVNEPDNIGAITDKLTDASTAPDQTGVDGTELIAARDALVAGDRHRARSSAELSIGAQPHMATAKTPAIGETTPTTATSAPTAPMPGAGMPSPSSPSGSPMAMATGAEPGEDRFADPLVIGSGLTSRDWTVLAASISIALIGVFLSVRFRPPHREVQP